ncbi:hypothetical protein DL96DRAFT_1819819 [Flagelloscypha sp. PMI_526]|nr:hypothetical protein DL96DRAFT_1819819 [Flagelloscypha sp. PMI_526]
MSAQLPGTIPEPPLESSPLLARITNQRLGSPMSYPIINFSLFTALSSFVFFSSVALGRILLVHGEPLDSDGAVELWEMWGEYLSAILAGVFFSISCLTIFAVSLSYGKARAPSRATNFYRNVVASLIWVPLNLLIGGPVHLIITGLILNGFSLFPDMSLKGLVCQYLVALPIISASLFVVGVIGFIWWNR